MTSDLSYFRVHSVRVVQWAATLLYDEAIRTCFADYKGRSHVAGNHVSQFKLISQRDAFALRLFSSVSI